MITTKTYTIKLRLPHITLTTKMKHRIHNTVLRTIAYLSIGTILTFIMLIGNLTTKGYTFMGCICAPAITYLVLLFYVNKIRYAPVTKYKYKYRCILPVTDNSIEKMPAKPIELSSTPDTNKLDNESINIPFRKDH